MYSKVCSHVPKCSKADLHYLEDKTWKPYSTGNVHPVHFKREIWNCEGSSWVCMYPLVLRHTKILNHQGEKLILITKGISLLDKVREVR